MSSRSPTEPPRARPRGPRKRVWLEWCRVLHIYLSMLGLLVLLLFGFTGLTLNHPDWFGAHTPRASEADGHTPPALLAKDDRLGVVESLRSAFHITGALDAYSDEGDRVELAFHAPGESWEIEITKADGATKVNVEAYNFIMVLNNLHRGRYTGPAWGWVIDLSAVLIVIACVTGVALWLSLPKRRRFGTLAFALGTIATLILYWKFVPGPDDLPPADQPPDPVPPANITGPDPVPPANIAAPQ